jgi:transposase-like protein
MDMGEKRDGRGRRITAARTREELVKAYRASGMTMAAFARREGVKYPTFAHWVLKVRKEAAGSMPASASKSAPIRFAELTLPVSAAMSANERSRSCAVPGQLEAQLPDGLVLRGHGAAELAALICALRS